ncbi:SDR family oxidoreductase [Streptomyces sp. NPDC059564]|uniref:SDR family oxidoreductase n=1 Tax=Streptomyces sp. NPDC059564 TaxID=3346865 RepID=UPI0036AE6F72
MGGEAEDEDLLAIHAVGDHAAIPEALVEHCTSKSALNAITVLYANELRAEGILVNAVSPGYCATDLNRHTGMRTAEEGAAVAVDLATAGEDGPTGTFRAEDGPIPW